MPAMAGRQPDAILACVGGGSNAMGIFHAYIPRDEVKLIGVEAGGLGHRDRQARGVALGRACRACCTATAPTSCRTRTARSRRRIRSRRASTIRAWVPSTRGSRTRGARSTSSVTDDEALAAFHALCRLEGIIPALESSHALAYAMKIAPTMRKDRILLVNLSGRGDKDMHTVGKASGIEF